MIEIKKGDGYDVCYDETTELFAGVINGETVVKAAKQAEVEEYAKKALKKTFKRVSAIHKNGYDFNIGEITSLISEQSYFSSTKQTFSVWFSWRDSRGESRREKIRLNDARLFLDTPLNREVITRLNELKEERVAIEDKRTATIKELSGAITYDNLQA